MGAAFAFAENEQKIRAATMKILDTRFILGLPEALYSYPGMLNPDIFNHNDDSPTPQGTPAKKLFFNYRTKCRLYCTLSCRL
jgi:hypothetical protein